VFDYQLPVGPLALFAISVLLLTFWQLNYRDTGAAPLEQRYRLGLRQAASQEERHRLARDLHDSVKQQVFAIQTAAATAQQAADPAESIALIRETARDMMTELDAMLDQLQAAPLTMSGLAGALRKLAETTRLRTGASLTVTIGDLPADEDVPPGAAQTLLRIAQEALSNTARHARASQVEVSLGGSDPLLLRVNDNGAGFDSGSDANGMGLRNIRARALELGGAATIVSSPGQGTRLTVETPARRAAPSRRQLAVTAVLTVCLLLLSAGPNPLHPLLLNALRGTMAIFIVLHFVGARKVEA
jgi:signal transduction histidine kinase